MYIIYKCSICKRLKSYDEDNKRVLPNTCSITKGCMGKMLKYDTSATPLIDNNNQGVENWSSKNDNNSIKYLYKDYPLFSSEDGNVILLKEHTIEPSLDAYVDVLLEQVSSKIISKVLFNYKIISQTNIISGKDLSNRTLSFDQSVIDEDRIKLKITLNGVLIYPDYTLTPNKITFATALQKDTKIDITIFSSSLNETSTLRFNFPNNTENAWGNLKYVLLGSKKYYVYYCKNFDTLNFNSKYKIVNEPNLLIALSQPPFEHYDRLLDKCVKLGDVDDYFIELKNENNIKRLYVNIDCVKDIFPFFTIDRNLSYYTLDEFKNKTSNIVVLNDIKLQNHIGPI